LLGYSIEVAQNGSEAVAKHATGEYALILMDCQMPIMDGYEATVRIRKAEREQKKHTPIVAMTASTMKNVRDRCFECGMDHFLSKPVTMEHLQQVIMVLLRASLKSTTDENDETDQPESRNGQPRAAETAGNENLQESKARNESDKPSASENLKNAKKQTDSQPESKPASGRSVQNPSQANFDQKQAKNQKQNEPERRPNKRKKRSDEKKQAPEDD